MYVSLLNVNYHEVVYMLLQLLFHITTIVFFSVLHIHDKNITSLMDTECLWSTSLRCNAYSIKNEL
jgi:hypothetical protein